MTKNNTTIWQSETFRQLTAAFVGIDDQRIMQNFLCDIMTEKEISEISARLEAAKMLQTGRKYTDIIAKTKLSSRTVARISGWLKNGCNGYQAALKLIGEHCSHIPPARDV